MLGRRLGLAAPGVRVVAMGGVTNIGRHLTAYDALTVAGLCDGSEMRFFARALRRRGHEAETRDSSLHWGSSSATPTWRTS